MTEIANDDRVAIDDEDQKCQLKSQPKKQPSKQPKNKEVEVEVYKENKKRKFLEYVFLTDEEYNKLVEGY